jgi:hypothetical protein
MSSVLSGKLNKVIKTRKSDAHSRAGRGYIVVGNGYVSSEYHIFPPVRILSFFSVTIKTIILGFRGKK